MKKLDEILGPKKSLQDLYTDFKTSDEIALENFESNNPGEDRSKYASIKNLLFPRSPDGILSGENLWKKIQELATPTGDEDDDANAQFIASKIRLYHYGGHSVDGDSKGSPEAAKEISEFYKARGGRPSAYNCAQANGFEHVDDPLTEIIKRAVSEVLNGLGEEAYMKSAVTMILVDEPSIDLKIRNAGITSTFINYMPGIMASQMVPFLDVRFSLQRNGSGNLGQTTMTPIKFLLGAQDVPIEGAKEATRYIYDAYTAKKFKQQIQTSMGDIEENIARAQKANAGGKAVQANNPQKNKTKPTAEIKQFSEQITTTGMEMFLMPQTLINMDYDQETVPRYNPVLNATLPFGTILSFTINVTSAGHGVFSYKTGTLTLKIFDRSRLVEIADFLNPKLYGKATLWMTYGWRAPHQSNGDDRNEYLAMINENMLKREAYGISNSSISIGDDGTATVTLQLFMKFSNELSQATPTLGSAQFEIEQTKIESKMAEIKLIAQKLGLGSTDVAEIRGGMVIGAALNGTIPTGDPAVLRQELLTISNGFSNQTDPDVTKFLQLAGELYSIAQGSNKASGASALDTAAQQTTENRFDVIKGGNDLDVWSVPHGNGNDKFKDDETENGFVHPLQKMQKLLSDRNITYTRDGRQLTDNTFGGFGTISFARLIATYLATTALTIQNNAVVVDEYQIIFYKLNDLAGPVAGINIGEFPIDMSRLLKAYSEAIVKQKGENMTFLNFLEIVRGSQINNQRHHAYGFSDLYDAEGKLNNQQGTASSNLLQRQLQNQGLGGSFVLPSIDFYVETVNSSEDNSVTDLLTTFEVSSVFSTKGYTPEGFKKILRIHIYDKATIPHKAASSILKSAVEGSYVEIDNAYMRKIRSQADAAIQEINDKERQISERNKKVGELTDPKSKKFTASEVKINEDNVTFTVADKPYTAKTRQISFEDGKGRPRFELAKREISSLVPTITIGTNGTTIKSVNYGSEQDAKLATIMMLRNSDGSENTSSPNGSSSGDLPLRVIPGSLSITTLGCPLLEYMQQFFIDLGTGTTIDNLYNITSLTHNISPGNFTSDVKFTFADAYGKYESPQDATTKLTADVQRIAKQAKEATEAKARAGQGSAPAKK
ncbi:MAG: hypothetical protein EBU90_05050 [Proteobacteria bacterium]|nr:hypothetical protein [Pseudomonadota bacterium]